jgi:F0F1-type ATP synthase membrane subunit b/b'
MRKHALVFSLLAGAWFFTGGARLRAQESHGTPSQQLAGEDEEAALKRWKLINSSIFALLLGFAVIKFAPKFFQARSVDIQKAIKDATGLKIDADFRYSEIDKKMAKLAEEVARMRADADAEMEREHQRLLHETEEEVGHMSCNTEYEIDSLRGEGALQVKRHTARLAFSLAERRLQSYFAREDAQNNVAEFVNLVGQGRHLGGNN